MWLDLARYADSAGHGSDPLRTIWRYRDWVIDAFDQNLPLDQFARLQLAGDLVPEPTTESRLATAFHRNTMTNTEGGTDDEEFRVLAVKDRVNTTGQVWLGLSVGCAECHSHKYDPLSQREYYAALRLLQPHRGQRPERRATAARDADTRAGGGARAARRGDRGARRGDRGLRAGPRGGGRFDCVSAPGSTWRQPLSSSRWMTQGSGSGTDRRRWVRRPVGCSSVENPREECAPTRSHCSDSGVSARYVSVQRRPATCRAMGLGRAQTTGILSSPTSGSSRSTHAGSG
jgi:hypothetical protein